MGDLRTVKFGIAAIALFSAAPALAQQVGSALPVPQSADQSLPILPPLVSSREREDALIGVAERFRPDFQPAGTRVGTFLVNASVRTAAGYNSNIFADEKDTVDDAFVVVEPVVSARSTWSLNELRLQARGRYLSYFNTANAEEPTYLFAADGRFLLGSPARIDIGANFGQRTERRDSSSVPTGTIAPILFRIANGYASGTYNLGNVNLVATADYTRFDFSNARTLRDGDQAEIGAIPQKFRDLEVVRLAGRVVVQAAPRAAIFGQVAYSTFSYDDPFVPGGLPNRDGEEFQATAGVIFDVALLRGEIGGGYVRHTYDSPVYESIEGLALDARLKYFLTPLVTLTAEGSRTVEETAIIGSGGFFSTRARLAADYELLRNLILSGEASYRYNEFRGIDRRDRILRVGSSARYLASRRINLDADFFVVDRKVENDLVVPDFTEFRATAGVTFRL